MRSKKRFLPGCGGFAPTCRSVESNPRALIHSGGDQEAFDQPDHFLLRRNTSRSALFGQGAHACPGQHLARLEMRIFFEELLPRLERIEIAGRPRRSASIFIGGPKTLPIRFKMN